MFKILKKYLPAFYILMLFANTTILSNGFVYLTVTIILLLYTFLQRKSIPISIIFLSLAWIFINFIAHLYTGLSVDWLYVFRGVFFYFVGPYVFLSVFGLNLLDRVLELIYYLTIMAIVFFIFNYFFLDFFNGLKSVFNPITRNVLRDGSVYWSSGIYTNAIKLPEGLRNCGFMWEPGSFSLMCVFAIIVNWLKNGISYDKKFIVFTIAILTTLSTAGYLSLFIIILAKYQKNFSVLSLVATIVIIVVFSIYIYQLPFLSGKINMYFEHLEANKFTYVNYYDSIKLGRFQVFFYDLKRIAYNPFGYGSLDRYGLAGIPVTGTNGVSGIFRIWGVFLGSYFFYHTYQFMLKLNSFNNNKRVTMILYCAFLFLIFSNPVNTNVFFYFVILTSILFKKINT